MPTSSEMKIPIPQSPYEFENICLDYIKALYPNSNVEKYGRQGQDQHGIDIYVDYFRILVQCKRYYISSTSNALQKANELKQQIADDYNSAKQHFLQFSKFIVITTFDRDANVQDYTYNLGTNIHVIFWDTIEKYICDNLAVLKKYYPQLYPCGDNISTTLNHMLKVSNTLIEYAVFFNKYYNYTPFINTSTDEQMFNRYKEMKCFVCELVKSYSNIILQTNNTSIGTFVDIIKDFIPKGYEEKGYGESLIVLADIIRCFNSNDKLNEFKNACDKLNHEIEEYYNKI